MPPSRLNLGFLSFLGAIVACAATQGAFADGLNAQQRRGKQLYLEGKAQGEAPPQARIGPEGTIAPASVAPCGNCHGEDGRGRPEGAIEPPDIRWSRLIDGSVRSGARRRAPFTEQIFSAAVTQGADPSGSTLGAIMPRYDFTPEQLDAVIAYLKIIEADQAPGVSEDRVRIGVRLPRSVASSPAGESVRAGLRAVFEPINDGGGIYGRRIDVAFLDGATEGADAAARDYFAVLDPSLAPDDPRSGALTAELKTPLIAAIAPFDLEDAASDPRRFFIFGGVRANMSALFAYAASRPDFERPLTAIVYDAVAWAAAPHVAGSISRAHGWPAPLSAPYDAKNASLANIVSRLQAQGVAAVVFLGDASALYSLLRASDAASWTPYLLLPAPAIDARVFDLPPAALGRLLLAYPVAPADRSSDASPGELRRAAVAPVGNAAAELATYCVAKAFISGLKDAGRELGARRFLTALERTKGLETGVSRPLSFGPDRRVGAPGAYVVGVDGAARRFIPLSAWLEADKASPRVESARWPTR